MRDSSHTDTPVINPNLSHPTKVVRRHPRDTAEMASIFGGITTETPKFTVLKKLADKMEVR